MVRHRYTNIDLKQLLCRHLYAHVVEMNGVRYHQGRGIPQGSVVSSALCNYYFADMERSLLLPIVEEALKEEQQQSGSSAPPLSCLMRLTDDFLFVSESKEAAKAFAKVRSPALLPSGAI